MKTALSFAVLLLLAVPVAQAEDRWVTDEFEVMMRTGKSNSQSIVRQLKSGTKVEILAEDKAAGYAQVRIESGAEGWVLSRYLKRWPTAQLLLPNIEARLNKSEAQTAELKKEISELKRVRQKAQNQMAELQSSGSSVQQQLDRVTKLSAGTIQVDDQNRQLKKRLVESDQQIELFEAENKRLGSRSNREWFLVGGAVLMLGLLLGLILPRISWKKKSSWSDF
ncbi:MAG: TIGR04211 family SH3 domain-containing protein [Xanthomonadales bacterium]|nr:TIGR04211 family SH3 domain-containing protein [Xanthomonadales bacterium]